MVFTSSHTFECSNANGNLIEMTMNSVGTTLSISCSYNYHQFLYKDNNSTTGGELAFKYYKSCLMKTVPKCSIGHEDIDLRIYDLLENNEIRFSLKKQELNEKQKIDIMFNSMMKEINMLKDKVWFLDRSLNKFQQRYVTNWEQVKIPFQLCETSNDSANSQFLFNSQSTIQFKTFPINFSYPVNINKIIFKLTTNSGTVAALKVKVYGVLIPSRIVSSGSGQRTQTREEELLYLSEEPCQQENQSETTISIQSEIAFYGIRISLEYVNQNVGTNLITKAVISKLRMF